MIRRSLDAGDLLIGQTAHAAHAARLAALLRALPEPREAVVRAVALHDAGWPLLDDSPEPLPDGRPPHVFDHEAGATVSAWRRSVAVARASGRLEGLLVSLHFSAFSPAFAREQAPAQAVWGAGLPAGLAAAGLAVLQLCDSLSLRLLCDPGERVALPQAFRLAGEALTPWPFDTDLVEDEVAGRLVPRQLWGSAEELQAACRAAPWVRVPVRLRRGARRMGPD